MARFITQTLTRSQAIVGVGPVVSVALTNTLEVVPFHSADAFIAFTDFDPGANDSDAVQLLFQDYRFRGWSIAAVWVIIARKISRDAWPIHHYKSTFEPERVIKNA